MGKCSIIWESWDKEKAKYVEKCCEKETWKGSNKFCIFHDPSPEKDADLLRKMIEMQIRDETEEHNFIGYCFPEDWDFFANKKLEIGSNFMNATFQGTANFREAAFQDADFRGATFQDVDFMNAAFQGTATFMRATFQDAGFWGATFQGSANFGEATFQDADFRGATFQDVDFMNAAFQGTANFGEATFQEAYFRGATFQDAYFWGATFQEAYFRGVIFQDADFREAIFQGTANFREAAFQDADFREAAFQDADFRGVIFQDVDFWGATFEKKLEFTPYSVEKIDLRDAKFLSRSKVTANLKGASFQRAFIENVAFVDCIWPKGYVIYEEKHMNNKEINLSFSQLETIYRSLKQNMQQHGDYARAGEFYFREMEMRRKGTPKKKTNRWWLDLYQFLAGYGERPQNIVRFSVCVIFAFALLYWQLGCTQNQYLSTEPSFVQQAKDAVYFSLVTFTTLGLGDIHPINDIGKFLVCCEAVLGLFLVVLFGGVFQGKMGR